MLQNVCLNLIWALGILGALIGLTVALTFIIIVLKLYFEG